MPISETYVIQFLVQSSLSREQTLQWYEKESEGYIASLHGLQLEIDNIPRRAGALLQLSFSYQMERVHITEPARTSLFTRKYASEEEGLLVRLMHELWTICTRQCAARRSRSPEAEQRLREWMFRRLTGLDDISEESATSFNSEGKTAFDEMLARFNITERL